MRNTDAAGAYRFLQAELDGVRSGVTKARQTVRFSEYAASLFERKVLKGEVASAQTRENWELMLRLHLFPAFGEMYVDAILEERCRGMAGEGGSEGTPGQVLTGDGEQLAPGPSQHHERGGRGARVGEEPRHEGEGARHHLVHHLHGGGADALTPEEVQPFLAALLDRHPQHFVMVALGFATGWRPSMMRPLRRQGRSADVLWAKNVVLARRSQTRGDEVLEATKNSTRFRVTLPAEVMDILSWHTDRLPEGPMQECDLLFPSDPGGFRRNLDVQPVTGVVSSRSMGSER